MDIQVLKEQIEQNKVPDSLLIFVSTENSFLSNQYIRAIQKSKNLEIEYLDNLSSVEDISVDIFNFVEVKENVLRVYKCDNFFFRTTKLTQEKNLIIVCNKYDGKNSVEFNDYVVRLPKIEDWMIRDYVYSVAEGVDQKDLDWLIRVCNNDIERIDQELNKLRLFDKSQQKIMFREFVDDSMFGDLSEFNIFNITNALQSKDVEKLKHILPEIKNIDVEAVGLVKLLWQNFRKMINVWLNPKPTPENTGLKSNQIYAINKLPRVFSKQQLIDIFEEVSTIDYRLKSGQIDASMIVDYLILKVLSI